MEAKKTNINMKTIQIAIGVGIWVIVLQNAGLIPKLTNAESRTQAVYVTGGNIEADVDGKVSIKNTVDVNIEEILGRPAGCRTSYEIDGREYQSLDVSIR